MLIWVKIEPEITVQKTIYFQHNHNLMRFKVIIQMNLNTTTCDFLMSLPSLRDFFLRKILEKYEIVKIKSKGEVSPEFLDDIFLTYHKNS